MGAKCDRCGNFDEGYREEMEYPKDGQHCIQDYQPDMYYYWDSPLEEDYDWRDAVPYADCLCERCFGDFLNLGKIITTDDAAWTPDEMGWFIPYVEEHGT